MEVIKFNINGYDPFIDFIKAYAIICVIIGHLLPINILPYLGYSIWMGMQVPLFILIQAFHVFKKRSSANFNLKKIFTRILLPYILIQFSIFLLLSNFSRLGIEEIVNKFEWGGFGPGSYYPWIYLQAAFILYWIHPYMTKFTQFNLFILFIILCEFFEIISSIIDLNPEVHRILVIRYIFLIYLGYIWVKDGIRINGKTIIISLISLIACIYFYYYSIDDEPLFYKTVWETHRWPCYYFVSNLMIILLYKFWFKIKNNVYFNKVINVLSKCSYEIFLVQMAIIPLFPSLSIINNTYTRFGIRFSIIFVLCICGGIIGNKIYSNIVNYIETKL